MHFFGREKSGTPPLSEWKICFEPCGVSEIFEYYFKNENFEKLQCLSNFSLAQQREVDACFPRPDNCNPRNVYYSEDGSCNNLEMTHWGRAGNPFVRQLPAAYADGSLDLHL